MANLKIGLTKNTDCSSADVLIDTSLNPKQSHFANGGISCLNIGCLKF